MGNVFGQLFRITTWGESHGGSIGGVIDGCPPGLEISEEEIQVELDRRRPGQSKITTQRKESDTVTILSGVYQGKTLGTPIALSIPNKDARPSAYDTMRDTFRPSHADFTYQQKYGIRNPDGGGRSSARETAARVAAGAIAQKLLRTQGIEIRAYVEKVHTVSMPEMVDFPSRNLIDSTPVRCPDAKTAEAMIATIEAARKQGDSVGGIIRCRTQGLPTGLGSPVFDRLEADLAKAMLSLPATKGFEVGSGFAGTELFGSEHNDLFENRGGTIGTKTNRSGGVQGGISNGEELFFRTAFKPTATILQKQPTVTQSGEPTELQGKGRHDPCVLPRAVPIVESMTALVLIDHLMRHHAQCKTFNLLPTS
ncbi:MAG: chorismate synthase [Opitutales bacterium]